MFFDNIKNLKIPIKQGAEFVNYVYRFSKGAVEITSPFSFRF